MFVWFALVASKWRETHTILPFLPSFLLGSLRLMHRAWYSTYLSTKLQSLVEADDNITLTFNDLPDVKIVRLEGATGSYDSIAEKVCLAWVVDKV